MLNRASIIAAAASLCLALPTVLNPVAAQAATAPTSRSAVSTQQEVRLSDAQLDRLKAVDPSGYRHRYQSLSGNDALVAVLAATVGVASADRQIQELAATTTTNMVKEFNKNTRGKTFAPTTVNGEWSLTLIDNAGKSSASPAKGAPIVMPKCWQAWVAAFAWYIGTGAICGAVSLATFEVAMAGGIVCFVGVFTSGMIINWNNAC